MFHCAEIWMDAGCQMLDAVLFFNNLRLPDHITSKPEGRNGCATIVRVVLYFDRKRA